MNCNVLMNESIFTGRYKYSMKLTPFTRALLLPVALLVLLTACEQKVKPPAHDIVKAEEAWEVRTAFENGDV